MAIQKEIIHAGLRLKHPSGAIATTALEDLHRLKETTLRQISFLQDQIKRIDADIARVEAFRKTPRA